MKYIIGNKNMSQNSSGISLSIRQSDLVNKYELLVNIVSSFSIYFSLTTFFYSSLKVNMNFGYVGIVGAILILLWYMLNNKRSIRLWVYIGVLIIFLVLSFVQSTFFINGFLIVINYILNIVGMSKGVMYPQYEITIDSKYYMTSLMLGIVIINYGIALLSVYIADKKKCNTLKVIALSLFFIMIYLKLNPSLLAQVLLVVSILIMDSGSFVIANKRGYNVLLYIIFAVFLTFIIYFGVYRVILPINTSVENGYISSIKEKILDGVNEFRYEKEETNNLPEGDFSKVRSLKLKDLPALEILMDKPESLYLRGYVGDIYTSDGWVNFENNTYYNSYNLVYWLNQEGFSSINQLSTVSDLIKSEGEELITMTVNNLNANSKYLYAPYEVYTSENEIEELKYTADTNFISDKYRGDRLYSYKTKGNLVKNYPNIAQQLYEGINNSKDKYKEYETLEGWYNEFIYNEYLTIPEDVKDLFKYQLGELIYDGSDHMSYEDAKNIVINYLNENMTYSTKVPTLPKNKDFLELFLKDSKKGYSVHYATAAAMLFRYLGIPSRYVEGYLITPSDVEGVRPYEEMVINGTNAHAWTEIYIDKLGWIPIEVTPVYLDIMEHPDEDSLSSEKSLEEKDDLLMETTDFELDTEIDGESEKNKVYKEIGIKILWIIAVIFLVLLCIYIVIKRYQIVLKRKSFEEGSNRIKINRMFIYSMVLLQYDGLIEKGGSLYKYADILKQKYSEDYVKKYIQCIDVIQESSYSTHEIYDEKVEMIKEFLKGTLKETTNKKSKIQLLRMRYIDFIY